MYRGIALDLYTGVTLGDSFNQSACLPVLLRVQYHTYEYSCTQYSL